MAKAKTPAKRVWRETRRKGERVLVDPAGRVYCGTAQEVREAARIIEDGLKKGAAK